MSELAIEGRQIPLTCKNMLLLYLTVNNLVQFERQSGYFENVVANEGLTGHLVIDLSYAVYPTFSPCNPP